jgi:N-methylhydantoinase B
MSTQARALNRNIVVAPDGTLACVHCGQQLEGGPADYVSRLPYYETGVAAAGPHIAPGSRTYVDADVVFRQFICPQCATAFHTEVVPVGRDYVPT